MHEHARYTRHATSRLRPRYTQHQRRADSNHPVSAICAHRLSAYQLQVTGKESGKSRRWVSTR
eukprot:4032999-Prymnesium_polylepis.1